MDNIKIDDKTAHIAEDLAAEIFAWIDSMMFDAKIDGKYDVKVIDIARYEAFKKKYIKSEDAL